MAEKAGKNLLLKMGDGATPTENFTTVGGMRSASMKLNNENIDVTNIESSEWKESLNQAGIRSVSISGSGVFTDGATLDQARVDLLAGTIRNYQIFLADTSNFFQGGFKITSMERKGDYNKEQTWSLSLESSGPVSYT